MPKLLPHEKRERSEKRRKNCGRWPSKAVPKPEYAKKKSKKLKEKFPQGTMIEFSVGDSRYNYFWHKKVPLYKPDTSFPVWERDKDEIAIIEDGAKMLVIDIYEMTNQVVRVKVLFEDKLGWLEMNTQGFNCDIRKLDTNA